MALRLPLISSSLFCKGCLAGLALLLACQANTPPPMEEASQPIYVLVIMDTAQDESAWLRTYRANLPPATTVAVSGYTQEPCLAILSRLPWLLQPGVDTLYLGVGESCAKIICDSLSSWSPSTYCTARVGIK